MLSQKQRREIDTQPVIIPVSQFADVVTLLLSRGRFVQVLASLAARQIAAFHSLGAMGYVAGNVLFVEEAKGHERVNNSVCFTVSE